MSGRGDAVRCGARVPSGAVGAVAVAARWHATAAAVAAAAATGVRGGPAPARCATSVFRGRLAALARCGRHCRRRGARTVLRRLAAAAAAASPERRRTVGMSGPGARGHGDERAALCVFFLCVAWSSSLCTLKAGTLHVCFLRLDGTCSAYEYHSTIRKSARCCRAPPLRDVFRNQRTRWCEIHLQIQNRRPRHIAHEHAHKRALIHIEEK
jgi:hypothetical protein